MVVAAATLASACDLGARDLSPAHGPALHLVASYPADGQGTNAAADAEANCTSPTPDCPVPTNLAIELRFDRFLLPGAGFASGATLYSGSPLSAVLLRARYDVLERVVVLQPSRSLQPHTLYTVELLPGANSNRGFWAFDEAPLEEAEVPLRFSFTTGAGPRLEAALPSSPETCETMAAGPFNSCASCHATLAGSASVAPLYPPMGLDLSSARGLFFSAVSRVAHQTATGNNAIGEGLRTPVRFGVQMNIVDPGSPATSYLLYKLLAKAENFQLASSEARCVTGYHPPVADSNCRAPDAREIARLRDWFVLGEPMPQDDTAKVGAIDHADLERIAAWIAQGAACSYTP